MSLVPWWAKVLITTAALVLLGYGVHLLDVSRQEIGYNRAMAEVTKQENESLKFALAEITRLNNQVVEAQNAAKERELEAQKYRTRISVLDGKLRDTQRSIEMSVASATADALRKATSAFNTLWSGQHLGSGRHYGNATHWRATWHIH